MKTLKFYRRRQFILGVEPNPIEGWQAFQLGESLYVTRHPDLPLVAARRGSTSATLLGYIINPYAPEKTDFDVMTGLVGAIRTLDDVPGAIEAMTGRFVLIVCVGKRSRLFQDAVGLRQVQYCRDPDGAVWCASQAEMLAEKFGFCLDSEVLDYREIPVFKSGAAEFWLVNDRTPYREIRALLPNHYLGLESGHAVRYWPRRGCIPRLSIAESIKRCAPILTNSIKAASERFDLRMGVSAGCDSRKTLAATRECSNRIYYFSHGVTEDTLKVSDVTVPARLLPKLGLQHHALPLRPMSDEFRALYEASATWAREKKGKNAYTLLTEFGSETTVLNSNISEVAQSIYYLPKARIDGRGLAGLTGVCHPLAITEFQKWLDGAQPACDQAGIDVLALFFLEQRMARWAVAAFAEYDIAHETFNPYNNRHLHCLMLAVDEHYRRDRMWKVSLEQIKLLWPEVLSEPINPQDTPRAKIQQFIRRFIVHKTIASWLQLYPYLRYLKKQRRFRLQQRLLTQRLVSDR
jgi:hypothetical protein